MKQIKCVISAIQGNLNEARRYIDMAYEIQNENKQIADWYRDMANSHLGFNVAGHSIAAREIEVQRAKEDQNELIPGMLAIYNEKHADLIKCAAEIRYLIDAYGK